MSCIFLAVGNSLDAQKNLHNNFQPFFDHINTINGLSSNQINCMYLDHSGFLWIGTQNGLNEYDGRNITTFRHSRFDSYTVVDNNIVSITGDDSGYLWIGTTNGISKFNPYNHQCVNYLHDAANPFSLNDNYKCFVYIDKEKTLWVGNESGLSYLDKKTNQFIHQPILPDSLNKRPLSGIGSFLEDRQGRFWLGGYSGLILYDRKTRTHQRFDLPSEINENEFNPITALFCDHSGRIWVEHGGVAFVNLTPAKKHFALTNGILKINMQAR